MPEATKMVGLDVVETSGVDHPAHMAEGWVVLKSAGNPADAAALLDTLTEEKPVTDEATPTEKAAETAAPEVAENEAPTVEDLQKALDAANAQIADLTKAAADAAEAAEKAAEVAKSAEQIEDEVLKSLPEPLRVRFEALEKAATESAETLRKEREAAAEAKAVEKAQDWTGLGLDAEAFGKALRQVEAISPDVAEAVTKALDTAVAQAHEADLFTEVGKSRRPGSEGEGAYARLDSIAKAAADKDGLSYEIAFTKAIEANPDLYTRYLAEKG